MGAREDRRGRLPGQLPEGELRVLEAPQLLGPRLHVPARQRAQLVERRPVGRGVLLERERERRLGLRFTVEAREGTEAVALERLVELGRTDRHAFSYCPPGPSPLWQAGHQ